MNQIQTNNHTQSHTINTNPHQNTQNTYHDSINSHTTISATTSQRAESNPLELKQIGLYESSFEHDACGIGAVASIKGERSYQVISSALNILMQLEHRGGAGAEDNTGDGAGILIQIPHEFFKTQDLGFELGEEGDYAIAQVFLSPNAESKQKGKEIFLQVLQEQGLEFLGLRAVPKPKRHWTHRAQCNALFLANLCEAPASSRARAGL